MIEFSLCCDNCGGIIHASRHSAARARDEARLQCGYERRGKLDLCLTCRDPYGFDKDSPNAP